MARDKTYKPAKKLVGKANDIAICQVIYENAESGHSLRTIAVALGTTLAGVNKLITSEKVPCYGEAYEAGRAAFETRHASIIEEIIENPETSDGLRYKAARENIRTLEEWAPAQRSVKVELSSPQTGFIEIESLTPEELAAIEKKAAEGDRPASNA